MKLNWQMGDATALIITLIATGIALDIGIFLFMFGAIQDTA
jgi:hypothetical protein